MPCPRDGSITEDAAAELATEHTVPADIRRRTRALVAAVRRGKLGTNPVASVDPPRAEGTRPRVWTAVQLRAFLEGVRDHEFYGAWLLFATTGMRRGRWRASRGTISI